MPPENMTSWPADIPVRSKQRKSCGSQLWRIGHPAKRSHGNQHPICLLSRFNSRGCPLLRAGILGILAVITLFFQLHTTVSHAQTFGAMKGFKVAEPYGPPYEKQTKSKLEAGKALLVPGGALLSEGVTLQIFTETNTPLLLVRAEHCFYNLSNHCVNSDGPLQMQTADGKFRIEGEGFFLQQTNSSMVVSNKVHTLIQADLLQSPSTNRDDTSHPDTGPLSILSDRFNYDGGSGLGIWQENVRVNGTNLALSSAVLTAKVPIGDRQLHSLVAERNVIIDYFNEGLHATGDLLNYAPDTGLARITENATWHDKQREGRGDELVIDRTNRIFQANGQDWLKLPDQDGGGSGFLAFASTSVQKASTPAQHSVEVVCDRYEIRTNLALFYDRVRLEEHLDSIVRGRMTCSQMTANFGGTNELQTIIADKDVVIDVIDKEGKHLTGGHAVYAHTNTTLEITQNPTWRAGSRDGKGDLLRLNTKLNEMQVCGNALLRLPANELAGQLSSTNRAATGRPEKTGTNQIAEIYCEQYKLRADTSVFLGGVYATHPEMNWSCEKLTVQMPTAGTTNVVAERNVDFNLLTQKGKIHGTGDKAVYSFGAFNTPTNGFQTIDQLLLTGTPAFVEGTNFTVRNPMVVWDRTRDKWTLPGGEYKIQGSGPALETNTFQLPKKKLTK